MIYNHISRAHSRQKNRCLSLLVAGLIPCMLVSAEASACTVPVFRYALEHWPASSYRLAVMHRGELTPEQKKALESLYLQDAYSLSIETHDVNEALPEGIATDHWKAEPHRDSLPYGLLFLPEEMRVERPLLWQGLLNPKGLAELKGLIYSPLMRGVCRALATGDSAVWIILKGKDEEANRRVRTLLDSALTEMQSKMKLPHELDPLDTTYTRPPAPGVQLQVRFSILEADLEVPENEMLKQILTALSPDPLERSEPIVMPVFGRCRALALLMGEDISEAVFWEVSSFLVGPCSCRVKQLNPGFDLLAPFPWDEILYGGVKVDQVMAALPGTAREGALRGGAAAEPEN